MVKSLLMVFAIERLYGMFKLQRWKYPMVWCFKEEHRERRRVAVLGTGTWPCGRKEEAMKVSRIAAAVVGIAMLGGSRSLWQLKLHDGQWQDRNRHVARLL